MAAFRSTGARQHAETLHSIDPGLIIVRVAPFRRPLGTILQQLRRHRAIVTAKQNIESKLTVFFSRCVFVKVRDFAGLRGTSLDFA